MAILLIQGCNCNDSARQDTTNQPALPGSVTSAAEETLTHDVGRVIAGETLTHDFEIVNTGANAIAIQSDSDIRRNCGCSSLVTGSRELQPGSRTPITVTIETNGMRGPFAKGGSVVWTAPDGNTRTVQVAIRGEVVSPLRADPAVIVFQPKDIRDRVCKELVFTENLPLDWKTFRVTCPDGYVRAELVRANAEPRTYRVGCAIPDGLESISGTITVSARVAQNASVVPGTVISLAVPVIAHQKIDLAVTPKILPIAFKRAEKRGTGRILLRGEALASSKQLVKSITCEGFLVEWKLTRAEDGKAAVVAITLTPSHPASKPSSDLRIELEEKGTYTIPIVPVIGEDS